MSVRIPISADASSATNALRDMQRAIEATGKSASRLADIDLSKLGAKKLAQDIETVRANIDRLINSATGRTAATARRIHGASFGKDLGPGAFLDPARWQALLPDGRDAARLHVNAVRYVTQGTQWQMPAPAQHQPGGVPPQGPAAGGGGDTIAAIGNMGWRAAGMMGAAMTVGNLIGAARDAERTAREESVGNSDLMRVLRDVPDDFYRLRTAVRDASKELGVTYAEAQRYTRQWVMATNETSGAAAAGSVRFAASAARGLGMDPGAMVGGLGRVAHMGEDPKRFAVMLAETMRDGHLTGQGDQVMARLASWSENLTRNMSDRDGLTRAAEMWAAISSSGGPGLRGEFGANVMDRVNTTLTQGGGAGDAGRNLIYRALARHGVTDPYDAQLLMEKGMFERVGSGPDAPTYLEAVMDQLQREYAGRPDNVRANAGGNLLGITGSQFLAFERARRSGGNFGRLGQIMQELGIDHAALGTNLGDAASIAGANAEQLGQWRTRMQANTHIPQPERDRLGGMSDDDARKEMVRLLATRGRARNEGEEVRENLARNANAYNEAGDKFIVAGNTLRDASTAFATGVSSLSDMIRAALGDPEAQARIANGQREVQEFFASPQGGGGGGAGRRTPTSGTPLGTRERNERAQEAYSYFRQQGWTHEQAAGLIANIDAESGFRHDAHNPAGGGRGAFGIAQWRSPRQADMLAWAQRTGRGDDLSRLSYADQLAFMQYELTEGNERPAGAQLRQARTAHEAGAAVSRHYERPGSNEAEQANYAAARGSRAQAVAPRLHGGRAGADIYGPPMPGSIPAPESPAARARPEQHSFNMNPLRVVHENAAGEVLREEMIPVTYAGGDARPWGMG